MATRTPTKVLSLNRKGRIAPGYDADLIVLDRDFNIRMTLVRGSHEPD